VGHGWTEIVEDLAPLSLDSWEMGTRGDRNYQKWDYWLSKLHDSVLRDFSCATFVFELKIL